MDFRFLYREDQGTIGPATWVRASALPIGLALVLTLIAWLVAPREPRNLAVQPFFSLSIVAVHVYFIAYSFALILLAVMQYFLSAKRFRDLGRAPALAGLAPFALLLTGAAIWFQPRSEGLMPAWAVWPFVAFAAAVVLWSVAELGFGKRRN
jgi:uncharacterized membrane protein YhaH (DUF805 family)